MNRRAAMKRLYLALSVFGLAVPYYFFLSFLIENGPDLSLLFKQLFANNISIFFSIDLIITAIVFVVFVTREAPRYRMANWWVYVVATLLVGPSFALPLFLHFREGQMEVVAWAVSGSFQGDPP
jgi:hypothetical protein